MTILKAYRHAITRTPPNSMANGITTQSGQVDYRLACMQHALYVDTLKELGVQVTVLEPDEEFPDSHFVEDAAIVHNNVAILTRPGAEARRGEVARLRPALEWVLTVSELGGDDGALVDGGDVLFMGNNVFIGISHRTNQQGAALLQSILQEVDPNLSVHFIPFSGVLHLKSGLTALSHDTLLGNPALQLAQPLPTGKIIWLPVTEGYAANALTVNGATLYFKECEVTAQKIKAHGLHPIGLDMSEFRKMDGSFTCLSLLF